MKILPQETEGTKTMHFEGDKDNFTMDESLPFGLNSFDDTQGKQFIEKERLF